MSSCLYWLVRLAVHACLEHTSCICERCRLTAHVGMSLKGVPNTIRAHNSYGEFNSPTMREMVSLMYS